MTDPQASMSQDAEPFKQDLAAAWKKLKDVSIEGDSMRLTMP